MTAPTPTTAAAAEPPHGWTARETSMWIRICELTEDLLAARRETETKDALLCEIAQAAIRAVDSPNFNGPRYRTALRQIAALAATPEER